MTTVPGVALVGCGLIGGKRLAALQSAGARVLALHDTDRDRAEALAARFATTPAVVDTAEAAYKADGVDLAVIATTHDALAPLSLSAIDAGCHVLVEKPGADRAQPLAEVIAAASTTERVVRVGFNHRFHPAMLKARDLVGAEAYGPILNVRGRYGHGGRVGYEREWRADRARSGGGELLDQGVHLIDLTRFFCGDMRLAFAELRTDFWPMDVEDNAFLALGTEGGAFAWLHASWTEWKNLFSFEIAMRDAKIEITGLGGSYGTERLTLHEMSAEMGPPATSAWEWPQADESWAAEIDDLLGALRGEASIGATLADAHAVLKIVEEAYAR